MHSQWPSVGDVAFEQEGGKATFRFSMPEIWNIILQPWFITKTIIIIIIAVYRQISWICEIDKILKSITVLL